MNMLKALQFSLEAEMLGNSLTVELRTLTPSVLVRIQVPQPIYLIVKFIKNFLQTKIRFFQIDNTFCGADNPSSPLMHYRVKIFDNTLTLFRPVFLKTIGSALLIKFCLIPINDHWPIVTPFHFTKRVFPHSVIGSIFKIHLFINRLNMNFPRFSGCDHSSWSF